MTETTQTDRSVHSHTDDREPPSTLGELASTRLRAGDTAVPIRGVGWFSVLRRSPTPAGEFHVDDGRTLDDVYGCDPGAPVVVVLDLAEAHDAGVDDLDDAVASNEVTERAVPASLLVPALEEFVAARERGEWSGVEEYVREVTG